MALAQETDIIFLDEPTTYLDMAHQLEVLTLLEKLNQEEGRTIIMVLHDINQAARFSDYIVALKNGEITKTGTPEDILTKDVLKAVFHIDAIIGKDPTNNKPMCLTYNLLKGDH
jgi:iron complex transport system ATP-binding protein